MVQCILYFVVAQTHAEGQQGELAKLQAVNQILMQRKQDIEWQLLSLTAQVRFYRCKKDRNSCLLHVFGRLAECTGFDNGRLLCQANGEQSGNIRAPAAAPKEVIVLPKGEEAGGAPLTSRSHRTSSFANSIASGLAQTPCVLPAFACV